MKRIAMLLLIGFLAFSCKNEENKSENLTNIKEQLTLKNDSLEREIVNLKSLKDSLLKRSKVTENKWFDIDFNGYHFTQQGIANPEEFVENALRKKADLIPSDAVLGGTMNYGKIQLLGNRWVIADYSDGHIQGRSIYEYRLNDKKELVFKILASNDTE